MICSSLRCWVSCSEAACDSWGMLSLFTEHGMPPPPPHPCLGRSLPPHVPEVTLSSLVQRRGAVDPGLVHFSAMLEQHPDQLSAAIIGGPHQRGAPWLARCTWEGDVGVCALQGIIGMPGYTQGTGRSESTVSEWKPSSAFQAGQGRWHGLCDRAAGCLITHRASLALLAGRLQASLCTAASSMHVEAAHLAQQHLHCLVHLLCVGVPVGVAGGVQGHMQGGGAAGGLAVDVGTCRGQSSGSDRGGRCCSLQLL